MDLLKAKLPLTAVFTLVASLLGATGAYAVTGYRVEALEKKATTNADAIKILQAQAAESRERIIRIEVNTDQLKESSGRIEKRLGLR
jgi:hypothetical protein